MNEKEYIYYLNKLHNYIVENGKNKLYKTRAESIFYIIGQCVDNPNNKNKMKKVLDIYVQMKKDGLLLNDINVIFKYEKIKNVLRKQKLKRIL